MRKRFDYSSKTETEVVPSFAKELRDKLGDRIPCMRLFGFKLRGDFHAESDIDTSVPVKEMSPDMGEKVSCLAAAYVTDCTIPLAIGLLDLLEYGENRGLGSLFFENNETSVQDRARTWKRGEIHELIS